MSTQANKALVRRLIEEAWNQGNLGVIDELVSPDYVLHIDAPGPPGREGYKRDVLMHRTAFPDLRFTIEDMVAEGDKVALRATLYGTHKGEYIGIAPTGQAITLTAISIRRIEKGQIAEEWVELDMLGLLQQLGVAPLPE
ncbi:MAG: ester cyclase [Chloroflexi bacterium]|nr:ester cyclase [Chloroflexota bacterium]